MDDTNSQTPPSFAQGEAVLLDWWENAVRSDVQLGAYQYWSFGPGFKILARVFSTGAGSDRPIHDSESDFVASKGRINLRIQRNREGKFDDPALEFGCSANNLIFDFESGFKQSSRDRVPERGLPHDAHFSVRRPGQARVTPVIPDEPLIPLQFRVSSTPPPLSSPTPRPANPAPSGTGDFHYHEGPTMAKYEFHGPVGAAGDHASASDFQKGDANPLAGVDLRQFAGELDKVVTATSQLAGSDSAKLRATAQVAMAKEAATTGDTSGVMVALKGAGKWAQEVASSITAEVAAKVILASMGMPG